MSLSGLKTRQWRVFLAAAIFIPSAMASVHSAESGEGVVGRSRRLLPLTVQLDRKAATAFETRSLSSLEIVYFETTALMPEESTIGSEINASACDVALANLNVIVGFAMNKLSRRGNYEDWMEDESLRLVQGYRDYLSACAMDAGAAAASKLTAQHVKAL